MFASIEFKEDHRCFKKGERVKFREGLNLVVGDQGSGKSTLLHQLSTVANAREAHARKITGKLTGAVGLRMRYFDFEKHNPRTQPSFDMGYGYDTATQIQSMYISHGELVRGMMRALEGLPAGIILVFDEPDAALSPRSVYALAESFKTAAARGVHLIAAVHNPILIESVPEVLSLEHRRWMPSAEFMATQKVPRPAPEAPTPEPKKGKRTK